MPYFVMYASNCIIYHLQLKREEAYDCIRAEAMRQGLAELEKQTEYKKAMEADIAKVAARELAINEQIQKDLEEERKKRNSNKSF
jgi:hypothetical protein